MRTDVRHRHKTQKNARSFVFVCESTVLPREKINFVGASYRLHSSKSILNLTCLVPFSSCIPSSDIRFDSGFRLVTSCRLPLPAVVDCRLEDDRLELVIKSHGLTSMSLFSPGPESLSKLFLQARCSSVPMGSWDAAALFFGARTSVDVG
jgi:hypothetical protein